jgi:hypothetical protein
MWPKKGRAGGAGPVSDGEGVLRLGPRPRVAREEPGEERVGLGGEGVDGECPTKRAGELLCAGADMLAAYGSSNVGGSLT